ncbi:sensor histidine kinase [Enterococcus sp.]|uniref:sensor histidine kinase n=1 Tax=Enterococcus sp. TaxID=35783 RepID=UPI002FCAD1DA
MKNKTFFRIYISILFIFATAIIIGTLLVVKQVTDTINIEKDSLLNELKILELSIHDELDKLSQSTYLISKNNSLLEFEINSTRHSPIDAYHILAASNFEDLLQMQSFSIKTVNNLEVYFPKISKSLGTSSPYEKLRKKTFLPFRKWIIESDSNKTSLSYYTNNINSKALEKIENTDYVVRISIDPHQMLAQNSRLSDGVGMFINDNIYTYNLFNESNKIFYENLDAEPNKTFFLDFKNMHLTIMAYHTQNSNGIIKFAGIRDITYILPNIFLLIIGYLTIIFLLSSVIFYALSIIRKKIHHPLQEVTSGLLQFQYGNYHYRIDSQVENEYRYIVDNFNLLGTKISTLIQDVIDEQDRTRHAELKQLQLQMNPHFLYNSLSFIASASKLNMNTEVVEMCYSLSDYYRYILSKNKEENTLKMELNAVETYLKIFQMRSQRVTYQFTIEHDFLDLQFPTMLLQPIVENSIKFGVEFSEENLQINISCYQESDTLKLMISDNGKIVTDNEIDYIKNVILTGKDPTHIGLINIQRRLHYHYGKQSSVNVFNNINRGLTVILKIPLNRIII